jgi:glycosyltransferase involved in cell wall biosynthesis
VIGILGNIREWKGQETVVRATAQLRSKFPNIVCLLVGDTAQADSHYEVMLRKFIAEHGLERNVLFTGYKKHVADYIQIMDIVIHASIDPEPFGRVLIEAMAMRKPLIGSHGGAVPEIVEQGVTGMTFTPGDSQALAQYVTQLLSDTASRREMGERAFARLTEHFHVQANVARTQEIYERLFAAGKIPVTTPSPTGPIQSRASTHD